MFEIISVWVTFKEDKYVLAQEILLKICEDTSLMVLVNRTKHLQKYIPTKVTIIAQAELIDHVICNVCELMKYVIKFVAVVADGL